MKTIKLKVEDVFKKYEDVNVLSNINFSINEGEFVSILGPSGCGKTTILKLLIGLEKLSEGKIIKDGNRIDRLESHERGMGIVFQNYALFPNMNVLENIMYALKTNKKTRSTAKQVAEELMRKVGLIEYKYKMPNELSGGQKQRVAIARTLVLKPDIILLDEALSSLDVENRMILANEFKNIQKEFAVTMIYITHDQEEAFSLSDKIIVMSKGKIEQIDTPEQIFKNPANEYVNHFVNAHIKNKMKLVYKITGEYYA